MSDLPTTTSGKEDPVETSEDENLDDAGENILQ
jgi:hypothetical protein